MTVEKPVNSGAVVAHSEGKGDIQMLELDRGLSREIEMGGKYDALRDAEALGQQESGYEGLSAWETIKTFRRSALYMFLVTFAAATDGYQISINGNIIANSGFQRQFATTVNANGDPALSASVLTAIGTIQSAGQIVAMVSMPFVAARFGRKWGMYILWLFLVVSVTLEVVARRWEVWFVGKLFSGMGVGSMQFLTPTYVSECAPNRIRGITLMLYSFWFSIGQFFGPVALQVMSNTHPGEYLIPLYTQYAQIALMITIYIFLPESPAWCAQTGRHDRGRKMLAKFNQGVENYDVDYQYQILIKVVEHEQEVAAIQKREKWYNIFRGVNGFRTMISCWMLVGQQVLGLTLYSTYSSYFFQLAGLSDPFLGTVISNTISLVALFAIVASVEKIGRRNIACSALTLQWVSNLGIGILSVVPVNSDRNRALVAIASFFSIGLAGTGATGWGYVGETSSQRLRAHTSGFAAAMSAAFGVITNIAVPYLINEDAANLGLRTAWVFCGVGAPFVIVSWFIMPETARRSASELDEMFETKVRPWRFHKTKTALQRGMEERSRAAGAS